MSPCFTRPRFQLGLSSRAPPDSTKRVDQHGPSGNGLRSSQCTQPCECFNVAISQAMNVVVLGILCSPASNSAVSLFVRSESWGRLMCLFRQTTRHHLLALNMKLSLSFIRLCIESTNICGFELLLSFVETRHMNFILQAFRLNDTCRCIPTSTSITPSKSYTCGTLHCFLNYLVGQYLASQYHWHIGSWDELDHFYHNL